MSEDNKTIIETAEKGTGLLGKLAALEKKYGFFGILKIIVLLFILGYVIYFVSNPTYLIDKMTEAQEARAQIEAEQHTDLVNSRLQADVEINKYLTDLMYQTESSRAWVLEFHNGSSNLASGLPFLYGTMSYEVLAEGEYSVQEEYSDFPLSRFPLIGTMFKDGYWYGRIEELEDIDQKLYHKFLSNGVDYAAMMTLWVGKHPLGVLGVTYCGDAEPDWEKLGHEIRAWGNSIATTLVPKVGQI